MPLVHDYEKKIKILHFLVIIHIFYCWLVSNQWMFFDLVMRDAPQSSQVEIQEYLDDISSLKLTKEESDWYNIDVAAMLNHVSLHGHEINEVDGSSLLFLEKSAVLCCPETAVMHHFPKNLIHCFVDDYRRLSSKMMGSFAKLSCSQSHHPKNNYVGKDVAARN